MPDPILELESVSVTAGTTVLLRDLSLRLAEAEVLAVVGPNGAGKSTLLRTICGEQRLRSGRVRFNGREIGDWPARTLARHLAVLPQHSVLNFPFTAAEVVALARIPHRTGAAADARLVADVLEFLDATHLAERRYPQLSGGEQQCIQLARVLAQIWQPADQPRLLLLDEPAAHFDLAHQERLLRTVAALAGAGVSIVLVVHDLNLAIACADRLAVLGGGELRALGPPGELLSKSLIRDCFGIDAQLLTDRDSGLPYVRLRAARAGG
ncbi:MAG: heme ABC transporter ATP-binding protein [Cellvibrionales bacterium]|nr:heme ABC transporter ATP-binding protein [Cellvibrionales bacterium]